MKPRYTLLDSYANKRVSFKFIRTSSTDYVTRIKKKKKKFQLSTTSENNKISNNQETDIAN